MNTKYLIPGLLAMLIGMMSPLAGCKKDTPGTPSQPSPDESPTPEQPYQQ